MSSSPPTEVGRAGTLQRQLVVRITLIVTAVAIRMGAWVSAMLSPSQCVAKAWEASGCAPANL